jgi:hypothetical protein
VAVTTCTREKTTLTGMDVVIPVRDWPVHRGATPVKEAFIGDDVVEGRSCSTRWTGCPTSRCASPPSSAHVAWRTTDAAGAGAEAVLGGVLIAVLSLGVGWRRRRAGTGGDQSVSALRERWEHDVDGP